MKTNQVKEMLLVTAERMTTFESRLCELDSYIGDGDHGVTVTRGFKAVREMLQTENYEKPGDVFGAVGKKLSATMGGAIGPILGSFFSAGVKKMGDAEEFTPAELEIVFVQGLKRIQLVGEAKVGDRTLVDALAPAAEAVKQAVSEGKDLPACMEAASKAAWEGAEHTKELVAQKGRAKFLGERSLGHVDAGATTMALIIETMMNYMKEN